MQLRSLFSSALLALLALVPQHMDGAAIPIFNSDFSSGSGASAGVVDGNIFDAAPSAMSAPLGNSGWYAKANVTALLNTGARPAVDANGTVAGSATIRYDLGVSLGGLLGQEMPEADLWQPLSEVSLQPHTTYTLTADVDAGLSLDVSLLGTAGVGVGLTVGATFSHLGTFVADSVANPGQLTILSLGNSARQLVLNFTTYANPAAGTLGVVLFAGRGTQLLSIGAPNLAFDNVQLSAGVTAVPEPTAAGLVLFALALLAGRRFRRPVLVAGA